MEEVKSFSSSFAAETEIIKLNNELKDAIVNVGILETEMNGYRKKILELEILKNDLREGVRKGKENIKTLQIQIENIKTEFWRLKKDGL